MGRLYTTKGDSMMRSSRMRVTGVLAVLVFLTTVIPAQANPFGTPMLEILPHQPIQKIAVEKSAVLTCSPNVADTNLISDLQWKDPMGRTIQPTRSGGDEMFTEALLGKLSLRLYIPVVRESMAGTYYCTANYANTEPLIGNVTIETFMAIKFNNAPENQYPIKGENYKVMCEVTARPSPAVDWVRNSQPITTGGRYVVETNGLLIKNVEESDDGKYTCRAIVISTGELAERHINLEVHTKPVMEQRELEVEVKEGETTSISCKAKGKPEPEYSWVKSLNQEDLSTADRFRVDKITGLLTITNVRQEDTGSYVCRATNAAGSDEITLNIEVLVPPRIYELLNATAPVKERSSLSCKATGRPLPTIQFKKWGTDDIIASGLQSEGRLVLENNPNRELGDSMIGTLYFEDIERTDDGLYECIATNKAGTAYKNGHLTVEFPPTFNATLPQGPVWSWNRRPANLTCLAESIPNATIEWRFHDRPLQESRDIKIFNAGALSYVTIVPTEQWMYNMYRCIATNKLGREHLDIELREARVPGLVLQSKLEAITATSIRFSLVAPAENDGPPILAFTAQYKEDRNFDYQLGMNKTWSINSPYVIEDLTPMTTYNFRFAAANQVGIGPFGAPQTHTTPRRSPPGPPPILRDSDSLTLLSAYADQYEVRWKIPVHNGEPIDMYDIKYCPVRKVNGEWQLTSDSECITQEIPSFKTVSYQMRSLKPDTYYKISLRAHNVIGFSTPSEAYVRTVKGIFDTPTYQHDGPILSSTAIVAVVVAGVILLLLIVDLILYCTKRQGVIASICGKRAKKHDDEETKLGRDEKEPLKDCGDRMPVIDDSLKRNTSVEFDGKKVYTTGGNIIGKNSAV